MTVLTFNAPIVQTSGQPKLLRLTTTTLVGSNENGDCNGQQKRSDSRSGVLCGVHKTMINGNNIVVPLPKQSLTEFANLSFFTASTLFHRDAIDVDLPPSNRGLNFLVLLNDFPTRWDFLGSIAIGDVVVSKWVDLVNASSASRPQFKWHKTSPRQ